MKDDGLVSFGACPKCDAIVLRGRDLGVRFQTSTLTIPSDAARILWEWGIPIWEITLHSDKIIASLWPGGYEKDWLVIEHECVRDAANWRQHLPDYNRRRVSRNRKSNTPEIQKANTQHPF